MREQSFPPASRRTDPISSHSAERRITRSGRRATQAERVYAALCDLDGATSAELAPRCGLDRWQTARRLPDLEAQGQIVKGAMRKCEVTGAKSVTWWLA